MMRKGDTPRMNRHLSTDSSNSALIMVFGSATVDDKQNQLLDILSQFQANTELKPDLCELSAQQLNKSESNVMALIMTNMYKSRDIERYLSKSFSEYNKNVHIYTYPVPVPELYLQNLMDSKEVLMIYQQLKREKHKSIKLATVYSIDKKLSSSKNITKISNESHYQKVKYLSTHEVDN